MKKYYIYVKLNHFAAHQKYIVNKLYISKK